jgi:hypothetical protein
LLLRSSAALPQLCGEKVQLDREKGEQAQGRTALCRDERRPGSVQSIAAAISAAALAEEIAPIRDLHPERQVSAVAGRKAPGARRGGRGVRHYNLIPKN